MSTVTTSRYSNSPNPSREVGVTSGTLSRATPNKNHYQARKQPYEKYQYSQYYSSYEILSAVFRDIYTNGPPSPTLRSVVSSYASMRLGVYSDMTNAVPVVHMGDNDYQSPAGFKERSGQHHPPYPTSPMGSIAFQSRDGAGSGAPANSNIAWLTALVWSAREVDMIPLAPGSLAYIEPSNQTMDYLLKLTREWATYSSATLSYGAKTTVSFYKRTGIDAIFRLTMHKARSFVSKSSMAATQARATIGTSGFRGGAAGAYPRGLNIPNVNDNTLHVAAIWDVGQNKWLLLGLFLCPDGMAIGDPNDPWSESAKKADQRYSMTLARKIPSEQRIHVDPLPNIVISEPKSRTPSNTSQINSEQQSPHIAQYQQVPLQQQQSLEHHQPILIAQTPLEGDGDDELSGTEDGDSSTEDDKLGLSDKEISSIGSDQGDDVEEEFWPPHREESKVPTQPLSPNPAQKVMLQNYGYDDSLPNHERYTSQGINTTGVTAATAVAATGVTAAAMAKMNNNTQNRNYNTPPEGLGLQNVTYPPSSTSTATSYRPNTNFSTPTRNPLSPKSVSTIGTATTNGTTNTTSTSADTETDTDSLYMISRSPSPVWPGAFPRRPSRDKKATHVPYTPPLNSPPSMKMHNPYINAGSMAAVGGGISSGSNSGSATSTSNGRNRTHADQNYPAAVPVSGPASREATEVINSSDTNSIPSQSTVATQAINDHIHTSLADLFKLAKSQGSTLPEFMSMALEAAQSVS